MLHTCDNFILFINQSTSGSILFCVNADFDWGKEDDETKKRRRETLGIMWFFPIGEGYLLVGRNGISGLVLSIHSG